MAASQRTPLLLLGLVVVVLGGVAAVSTVQLSGARRELTQQRQAVRDLTADNNGLHQQLMSLEEDRKKLEGRLTDLRNQLAATTGEVGRLQSSLEELQNRAKALESEKTDLDTRLQQLTKERENAQQQAQRLTQEKQDLERSVLRLRQRFQLLDRDYRTLSEKLAPSDQSQLAGGVPNLAVAAWPPNPAVTTTPERPPQRTDPSPVPDTQTQPSSSSSERLNAAKDGSRAPQETASSSTSGKEPPVNSTAPTQQASPVTGRRDVVGTQTSQTIEQSSASRQRASQIVELPPIVVQDRERGVVEPIRARVIEVNPGHRFVVIDKGAVDGVGVGMAFDILRGGTKISRATVVRVRPRLAACDLVASSSPGSPQVGDSAVQLSL
ncbi:MAG: hypothetical protein HYZ89_01120 [Candidatus Omnitrophica bacterium]|nr:hypothetical protein [Candidatus Omnitrophota bacterium]